MNVSTKLSPNWPGPRRRWTSTPPSSSGTASSPSSVRSGGSRTSSMPSGASRPIRHRRSRPHAQTEGPRDTTDEQEEETDGFGTISNSGSRQQSHLNTEERRVRIEWVRPVSEQWAAEYTKKD